MNSFITEFKEYRKIINQSIDTYIQENNSLENKIYEAMRYSLLAGGKRIRPILMLAVNNLFDGDINDIIPFACAIEMIHTYSLIHDDLPAMDDDDYRRGNLTNHKMFGEGIAILAGDALLNKAFEVMIDTLNNNKKNIERKIKVIQEIVNASGTNGMIGGQVIDLESEGKKVDGKTLKYMHDKKTGNLIVASAVGGSIIAKADKKDIKNIKEYASHLGLAFQIKDDILSEIGEQKKLGKKTGNDREKNKATYVTIFGLEQSKQLFKETTEKAIQSIKCYKKRAQFLVKLAEYLLQREN